MGRTSVCTTMSCSSLYTNGVIHHRNSRSRLGDFPKNVKNHLSQGYLIIIIINTHTLLTFSIFLGSEKYKDHVCANRLKNMRESQTSLNIQHKQHSIIGSNGMVSWFFILILIIIKLVIYENVSYNISGGNGINK